MNEISDITWETLPILLLTIAVAVIGGARFVRVVVYDDFPPAKWWREVWVDITRNTGWGPLFTCWWCFSIWAAMLVVGWYIAGLFVAWIMVAWWITWGTLALGYLIPMLIQRDGSD